MQVSLDLNVRCLYIICMHQTKHFFVLSDFDDCVYWYTYGALGKLFVDDLVKKIHMNFLGCAHWFMSIIIYQIKDDFIYVDQDRYATYIVAK